MNVANSSEPIGRGRVCHSPDERRSLVMLGAGYTLAPYRHQEIEARVIDLDGVYDPCRPNDRLLLGMKGSIS
jgi:hypothetical protein